MKSALPLATLLAPALGFLIPPRIQVEQLRAVEFEPRGDQAPPRWQQRQRDPSLQQAPLGEAHWSGKPHSHDADDADSSSSSSSSSAGTSTLEHVGAAVDGVFRTLGDLQRHVQAQLDAAVEATAEAVDLHSYGVDTDTDMDMDMDIDLLGGRHEFPDHTIYELVRASEYTTKFAKVLDRHPDVVDILNSTAANHTLFVPIDEAFKDIPKHHHDHDHDHDHKDEDRKKKIHEWIGDTLRYHIGVGNHPAKSLWGTHTIATELNEDFLGGDANRLRTRVGLTGVYVNFFSKVVATDIFAKNGVIHGLRRIVPRPFMVGRVLSLVPSQFSTLLLAYDRTDFVDYIHHEPMVGTTVFAPTNRAFAALGPAANAYLFNTDHGKKCLAAILKYHVVANATLYSDAFYDHTADGDDAAAAAVSREHYDLTTLLHGAHLSVDVASWAGFIEMTVNGFSAVKGQDVVSKNGVIQVINRVLFPPKNGRHHDGGETSVEELVDMFGEYME